MAKTMIVIFGVLLSILLGSSAAATSSYNVVKFGAKGNGVTDSTKAFLSAWAAACSSTSSAIIYVPSGRFLLGSITFSGQTCKSKSINIKIDGTLVAPSNYNIIGNSGNWIKFQRVNRVSISGGTLDARGQSLWDCKASGKSCPTGSTSLSFYNSNNIAISKLTSLNSQMFNILIYGCRNAKLKGVRVMAPGNSPNTDGIHVALSTGVSILSSKIGTGDDCISIGPGTSNMWVENVACGPGHGISIGSLGWDLQEAGVQNITVKSVTFVGTQNGVRIKTWARPSGGFVKNVLFQHITMVNVQNPVLIEQNYCPNNKNCPNQESGVKISGVTYHDIHGTSATPVAVKFQCSKAHPCSGIKLQDVNLNYRGVTAQASCVNADGMALGLLKPSSCFCSAGSDKKKKKKNLI